MTKREFLMALNDELYPLSEDERSAAIKYYSDYIDVYIPFIKGIVPPYYPTVFNYILTSVSNYTTVQNDGGWTVTFDSWLYSGNDYTFKLDIYSSSGTAILNISSMAYNTVTYSGYITQVY